MKFKNWADENYTEDWRSFLSGVGNRFKAAGRALGISRPKPVEEPAQPVGRALGISRPKPVEEPAQPLVRKTVGFGAKDLHNVKAAITDYSGLVNKFLSQMNDELKRFGPSTRQLAIQTYQQNVKPHIEKMKSWVQWINDMVAKLPMREDIDILNEGIPVNYKNFENMAASIRDVTNATKQWLKVIAQSAYPNFMLWAKDTFQNTVGAGQAAAAMQFSWLNNKIKELMAANQMQYQGLENSPYKQGQAAPNRGETNPGPQMYRGIESQGREAQAAKKQGLGISMLSRGQPSSVPLSPVGSQSSSMLSRGPFSRWMDSR